MVHRNKAVSCPCIMKRRSLIFLKEQVSATMSTRHNYWMSAGVGISASLRQNDNIYFMMILIVRWETRLMMAPLVGYKHHINTHLLILSCI